MVFFNVEQVMHDEFGNLNVDGQAQMKEFDLAAKQFMCKKKNQAGP